MAAFDQFSGDFTRHHLVKIEDHDSPCCR
jgi:hypothetical protein